MLPLRAFEIGNPDWRPLGWLHAGIVVALSLLLVWKSGGSTWVKHFAFPICFIFIAVPWISGIETPIIQGLMRFVAAVAAEILNLLGVPAQLEGNLIRVNSGLVGVNEACSGVRSLQTSLMIGLLFGELKRLALVRRILLLAGAVLLALLANCVRALLLVWLAATRSPDSLAHWHDLAGYSIVAVVFVGTLVLARALANSDLRPPTSDLRPPTSSPFLPYTWKARPLLRIRYGYFLLSLLWLLLVEAGVEGWYRAHERNLIAAQSWSVAWPSDARGFRDLDIDEGVRRTLRFDHGREAAWTLSLPNETRPASPRVFTFFFRWNSGGSTVLRARAHRPDICLPDAGWQKLLDRGEANYSVNGVTLPFRRVSFRKKNNPGVAQTYFCLQEDARHPLEERPDLLPFTGTQPEWSMAARVRVVREGIRNLGQQVLEIVLFENGDASDEQVERDFSQLLQQLVRPSPPPAKS
ncbi:MAG: exosortase/archaeosortase family protein [Verrucomicrobiota bacterium]|nr:exosortase/archaeosortase family protein [Verrucomicrobiota bacterium]